MVDGLIQECNNTCIKPILYSKMKSGIVTIIIVELMISKHRMKVGECSCKQNDQLFMM